MGRGQGCYSTSYSAQARPSTPDGKQSVLCVSSPKAQTPPDRHLFRLFAFFTMFNFLREAITRVQVKVTGA